MDCVCSFQVTCALWNSGYITTTRSSADAEKPAQRVSDTDEAIIFGVKKYRDLETGDRGHSRSSKMVQFNKEYMRLPIDVLQQLWLYLMPFLRYLTSKNTMTLKSGSGSVKVTEEGAIREGSYDLLLVFCSNFVREIFALKNVCDLETGVWGHSRSSKMVPVDRA